MNNSVTANNGSGIWGIIMVQQQQQQQQFRISAFYTSRCMPPAHYDYEYKVNVKFTYTSITTVFTEYKTVWQNKNDAALAIFSETTILNVTFQYQQNRHRLFMEWNIYL